MNPPAADEVGGAGDGEMGAGLAGRGSGSFNARKSWVNPPLAATGFSVLGAAAAKGKSSAGFCWSRSVGKDVSCAGDAGTADENMLVNAPGSLDDKACGAGSGAAAAAPVDWNMRVNAPGSLDDGGCGAAAGAAGEPAVEDWKSCVNSPGPEDLCEAEAEAEAGAGAGGGVVGAGAGAFPESVLNICVKLLGASEGCGASASAAAAGAELG